MNAVDLLLREHDSHRKLLEEVTIANERFSVLRDEVIHHVNMEEAILYPNLLRVPELESIVREAWEEHSLCMQLIQEMDAVSNDIKAWEAKFSTFKKLLISHLDDEEERLFPRIRALASEEFLLDVGEQMLVQKASTPTDQIIYPDEPGSHKI